MKKRWTLIILLGTVFLLGLVFELCVGYYKSYVDHDEHVVYFVKRIPTFRRVFVNPFANEGDATAVHDLPSGVRRELADFCKYAYGVTHCGPESLEQCRSRILRDVQ